MGTAPAGADKGRGLTSPALPRELCGAPRNVAGPVRLFRICDHRAADTGPGLGRSFPQGRESTEPRPTQQRTPYRRTLGRGRNTNRSPGRQVLLGEEGDRLRKDACGGGEAAGGWTQRDLKLPVLRGACAGTQIPPGHAALCGQGLCSAGLGPPAQMKPLVLQGGAGISVHSQRHRESGITSGRYERS